jgi:diacylglycerol kinase family enzyme
MLVVNPNATTTSPRVTHVITGALASELELTVARTEHRGHAIELAAEARSEQYDVVVTLGGDGLVNEVINGLMADGPGIDVPRIAAIPGGSANVFARALGIPADPVEATGLLLDSLFEGRTRRIGLGHVEADGVPRWFAANAGLGLDAEIIEAMEVQRRTGKKATPARYLATTLRQYAFKTDRSQPTITVERHGQEPEQVFLALVQNTAPWTYLGPLPIDACPQATFEAGLDVFAMRSLRLLATARAARRLLTRSGSGTTKGSILLWHDQTVFSLVAASPVPMQLDGEHVGSVSSVRFRAVPDALDAVC